jgi:hypothetical protein
MGRSIFVHRPTASIVFTAIGLAALHVPVAGAVPITASGYQNANGIDSYYSDPSAALGLMNSGGAAPYGEINPFNPPFNSDAIVEIDGGGSLTLQLSAPATEIGVFSNNGLVDTSADYSGQDGSAASLVGQPSEAIVSVSSDGVHYTTLNGGNPIVFDAPTNYWADGPGFLSDEYDFQFPGTIAANQDQPWYAPGTSSYNSGTLSDFDGLDYAQIKSLFAGSAGGTWFDAGMAANYVTFTVPDDDRMIIASMGGVPEPMSASLLLALGTGLLLRRRGHA